MQNATDLVLEMRRFAEFSAGNRLHMLGPAPSGLEGEASDLAPADGKQVDASVLECSSLIGCCEALELSFCHDPSPLVMRREPCADGTGDHLPEGLPPTCRNRGKSVEMHPWQGDREPITRRSPCPTWTRTGPLSNIWRPSKERPWTTATRWAPRS